MLQVATMFQKLTMEDGILEVTEISEKQESKSRPAGLNTVNLLKVRKFCKLTCLLLSNIIWIGN